MSALLELRSIGKSFPGTRALDGVSLEVRPGEVVALLGENGAGKSTLMKILSGVWPAGSYEGEIRIGGGLAQFRDTRDAHAAGIAMIHQELAVFPQLTVGEHLELDQLPAWIDWATLHRRAQDFLDHLGFGLLSETRVGDLSVGGRQLVEIARALYRDARILIFDEPTSALTEQEVQVLYRLVEELRAQGRGIIYITHRLDEVFRLADRMVILRDGRSVAEAPARREGRAIARAELEPQLIAWMVGRAVQDIYPPRHASAADAAEILRVEGLHVTNPRGKRVIRDISFTLRRGEVLGLAGLLGAGRSETFEALFGVLHGSGPRGPGYRIQGDVWVNRRRKAAATPAEALGARLAYVSEDRKGNGLVLNQSIRANMVLPDLVRRRAGWLDEERERADAGRWARELKLKAAHLDQAVGELSGGNQQKVVIAKWLLTEPDVLFLDEPTRGIDVGAKIEIYQWIQKLAAQGMGIVVASSEMPELLGVCHRILVLREGQLTAEFPAARATQEEILKAASL